MIYLFNLPHTTLEKHVTLASIPQAKNEGDSMTVLDWTSGVHHDGSALHVSNLYPTLEETVTVRLRVPRTAPVETVRLRLITDGEQHHAPMTLEGDTADSDFVWYRGDVFMRNPRMNYRFELRTENGVWYFTGLGMTRIELPDLYSFKLIADYHPPAWVFDSVFYQIFPERFYNGDPSLNPEPGVEINDPPGSDFITQLRDWDTDAPLPWSEGGMLDFFGGDIPGITAKLDYLQDLGVNALYLNPIFTSPSNHKYNINDFYNVDPHFGGNEALIVLREALDKIDFKLVLDVTPNHTGDQHPWFVQAQADAEGETAVYYTFYEHPYNYESWLGIPTLPKLNYASEAVRKVMIDGEHSVIRHWLRPPYRIDGWRLDVWNMTGRQAAHDSNHWIGKALQQVSLEENPDAYIFGESFFDALENLQGDQLDAVMNYRGFANPVWRWLGGHVVDQPPLGPRTAYFRAEDTVHQMQHYLGSIPWVIARQQFNLLDSHDSQRILGAFDGDKALVRVAVALLFTFPGVPCIYYGDEIGMSGSQEKESHRYPMPWDESKWDMQTRDYFKQLIHLRRNADALINGGVQFLHADGDLLAFQRHSETDRLLIVTYRGPATEEQVQIPIWHGGLADSTTLKDVLSGQQFTVSDQQLTFDGLAHGAVYILKATSS